MVSFFPTFTHSLDTCWVLFFFFYSVTSRVVAIVTFDVSVGRHAVAEQLHVRLHWLHPVSRSCHNKSMRFQTRLESWLRQEASPPIVPGIQTGVRGQRTWDILFRNRDVYTYDISRGVEEGGGVVGGGGSISGCRKPLFSFLFPREKQQDTAAFTSSSSSSS